MDKTVITIQLAGMCPELAKAIPDIDKVKEELVKLIQERVIRIYEYGAEAEYIGEAGGPKTFTGTNQILTVIG